jgi:hypothetical protein
MAKLKQVAACSMYETSGRILVFFAMYPKAKKAAAG